MLVYLSQREAQELRARNAELENQIKFMKTYVHERPLKSVLDFLSSISGKKIYYRTDREKKMIVELQLKYDFKEMLNTLAKKHGLIVDTSDTGWAKEEIVVELRASASNATQN